MMLVGGLTSISSSKRVGSTSKAILSLIGLVSAMLFGSRWRRKHSRDAVASGPNGDGGTARLHGRIGAAGQQQASDRDVAAGIPVDEAPGHV